MPQPADYTLSTRDAAVRLGVNLDTVARWADQGKFPCLRTVGGHRRFREADIARFAQSLLPEGEHVRH